MRRFFVMWIAFLISVSVNICLAYVYDNDSNYVYIGTYGSGGYSTYLYLPSVDVQEYNPPHYQIAGNFITIGGKETISEDWLIHVVRYNWYTKETYSKNFQGIVVKEKIIDSGDAGYYRRRADALFRAAYGVDFYGY